MGDEELKELLKIDFPEIKGDENKVLTGCKASYDKYNKKITGLAYTLSSFVIIVCIVILSIVLINNKANDVIRINKSIDSLARINDDETKMLRIMTIEKELLNVSAVKKENINISKLSYEKTVTVNELQQSVEWNDFFLKDGQYCTLESVNGLREASIARVVGDALKPTSSYERRINDGIFNEYFFDLVDIPYSEIVDLDDEELINMFRNHTTENDNRLPFYVMYGAPDDTFFEFMIHPSGYVVISVRKPLDDKMAMYKKYVSIVRINYEEFNELLSKDNLEKYDLYENYNIELNIIDSNHLDTDFIEFLSISENFASSTAIIVENKDDINLIMSLINGTNVLFAKERYNISAYDLSCITIGIAIKTSDGSMESIVCKVSNEGILSIKTHNDPYIYYTDKGKIDYNALALCIKEIVYN